MVEKNDSYSGTFWDDIEVGHSNLNHSENFFSRKHIKHEKHAFNNENDPNNINVNANQFDDLPIQLNQLHIKSDNDEKSPQKPLPNPKLPSSQDSQATIKSTAASAKKTIPAKTKSLTAKSSAKTDRPITRSQSLKDTQKPQAFNVCKYVDQYAANHKNYLSKLMHEDKKKREFHSRPAPDYTVARKKLDEKFQQNRKLPTCPETPNVYKSSQNMLEKRDKKIEEYHRQLQPQPFVANECIVATKKPFKPKLDKHVIEVAPFPLAMLTRLQERRKFDERKEKMFEMKRKQKEEEERQRNEAMEKELRKLTVFKARANPFS